MIDQYSQRNLWLRQWKSGLGSLITTFCLRFDSLPKWLTLYWTLILFVFIGFVSTATSLYLSFDRRDNSFSCSFECDRLSEKNIFQNLFLYWIGFVLEVAYHLIEEAFFNAHVFYNLSPKLKFTFLEFRMNWSDLFQERTVCIACI